MAAAPAVARRSDAAETEASGAVTPNLNIGTRKSKLALAQTDLVVGALRAAFPSCTYSVKARDTAAGDIDKVTPFKDMAAKNIWTHELEALLVDGELDMLVHSLKDVPTTLPSKCEIGGVLIRGDPRDAFVIKAGRAHCSLADMPAGSVVGTSSIRRTAQIKYKYPHLKVVDCRGNVGTRLNKLDAEDGPFDAVILAAAGLIRLNLTHRISQFLDSKNGHMLHAVGQGAIGIENKSSDPEIRAMLARVSHKPTFLATTAERSLLRTLEGGCSAPLGTETAWLPDGSLRMQAIVVSVEGTESATIDLSRSIQDSAEAEQFGVDAAAALIQQGADKILAEIQAKKPTTAADLEET